MNSLIAKAGRQELQAKSWNWLHWIISSSYKAWSRRMIVSLAAQKMIGKVSNGCKVNLLKWGIRKRGIVDQPAGYVNSSQDDRVYELERLCMG